MVKQQRSLTPQASEAPGSCCLAWKIESEDNDREAKKVCRWFQRASADKGVCTFRRSDGSIDCRGCGYEYGNLERLDESSITRTEASVWKGNPIGRVDAGAAVVSAAGESRPGRRGAECLVPGARGICA